MSRQPILTARKSLVRDSLDWQVDAACAGEPLSTFFPDGPRQEAETDQRFRELCASCPVRTACLDYAIHQPEKYGRWAGLNEDERAVERRKRMRRDQKTRKAPKPTPVPKKGVRVNAVGARRRLRAATVTGRVLKAYSRLSGVSEGTLSKIRIGATTRIDEDTARRIADAYLQVLALDHQVYRVSLQLAAEHGWPGPDAWDGVDMDDPAASPREVREAA